MLDITQMELNKIDIRSLPLKIELEIYLEVMSLGKQNLTVRQIQESILKDYGILLRRNTIYRWATKRNKADGRITKFTPVPSPGLSYVVGAFLGDASRRSKIKNYKYLVGLKVKDKEFAEAFSKSISRLLNKKDSYPVRVENDFTRGRRKRFAVSVSNRLLNEFLAYPLEFLIGYVKQFPQKFLRGLFDSDGFTAISAKTKFSVGIGLVSTNIKLLRCIKTLLKQIYGISSIINISIRKGKKVTIWDEQYTANENVYVLSINRFIDVEKFIKRIGFSIKRKQEKLEDAIKIFKHFNSKQAVEEWKRLYEKHGREWIKK